MSHPLSPKGSEQLQLVHVQIRYLEPKHVLVQTDIRRRTKDVVTKWATYDWNASFKCSETKMMTQNKCRLTIGTRQVHNQMKIVDKISTIYVWIFNQNGTD